MAKAKILVVDDETIVLDMLIEALGDDYDLYASIDGDSALKLIEQGESPDLVLLDIQMPGMDGYEVCRRLQSEEATSGIPVIFLTGRGSDQDEARGFACGAVDYISKPFNPSVVKSRIRTHLELKTFRDHLQEQVQLRTRLLAEAVAETKKKELYLEGVINAAPVGIGLLHDQTIVTANQMLADLTGFKVADLVGLKLIDLYPEAKTFNRDVQMVQLLLGSHPMAAIETRLKRADGKIADFSLQFSAVTIGEQNSELIFTAMDISERKRYEAELEERIRIRTRELHAANQLMQQEIAERKRSEEALLQSEIDLEKQRAILEESNIALRVLIRDAEKERRTFEERVSSNLLGLVDPYLEKLKKDRTGRTAEELYFYH